MTSAQLGERRAPTAGLSGAFVILPVGACEAHGPHLPIDLDVRIAVEQAVRTVRRLDRPAVVLPPVAYGITRFARNFDGTLSIPAELVTALVTEILCAAHAAGAAGLGLSNAHFEPAQVAALFAACRQVEERTGMAVVFPNFGARRHAGLGIDGHAGRYETSLALALAPELVVGHDVLPEVTASLGEGIVRGATCFEEAGGPAGYFGAPARADAAHGEALLEALAELFRRAIEGAAIE